MSAFLFAELLCEEASEGISSAGEGKGKGKGNSLTYPTVFKAVLRTEEGHFAQFQTCWTLKCTRWIAARYADAHPNSGRHVVSIRSIRGVYIEVEVVRQRLSYRMRLRAAWHRHQIKSLMI